MGLNHVPDQGDDFRKSGMVLITDPRSDVLMKKASDKKTSKKQVKS